MELAPKETLMPPGGGHHAERGDDITNVLAIFRFSKFHKFMKEGNIMKRALGKTVGLICIGLLLLVGLSAMENGEARAADTFKIGETNPFSGPAAYLGTVYHEGTKFVVDEWNAKGGILGKKIEIISEDNEFKPDVAVRKVKKMILQDKVNIFGSGTGSHIAVALNKVAKTYKTVGVNYGFSQPCPKKDFTRYYFRAGPSPYGVTSAQAQLLATTPYRRIYLIYQDYAYGHAMVKYFKEHLKRWVPDAKVVGEDAHPLGCKDFAPYINKIMASKADCIWSSNFGVDALNLAKQARALGLKRPFPIIEHLGEELGYVRGLGDDAVDVLHAFGCSLRVPTQEHQEMIAKWHELHKNDKDPMTWWPASAMGDTIMAWKVILAAIEEAGSFDPDKIIETFEGFWYKTPVGFYEMRKADHQMIMPYTGGVIEWDNPYYDGSIRPECKYPWLGKNIKRFPAMETASPPFYH